MGPSGTAYCRNGHLRTPENTVINVRGKICRICFRKSVQRMIDRKRAAGICVKCGNMAVSNGVRCEKHTQMQRERANQRRRRNPGVAAAYIVKLKSRRRALGLCTQCETKAVDGLTVCAFHREWANAHGRLNHKRHREAHVEASKQYRAEHKEELNARQREYYARNREKNLQWMRERAARRKLDPEAKKADTAYWTNYERERKKTDVQYYLRKTLRVRLRDAFRNYAASGKCGKALELVGCTIPELIIHIESRFLPGMTWENRTTWHLDHKKPLSSFNLADPEERQAAFHFSNLQPLWATDNLKKGAKFAA